MSQKVAILGASNKSQRYSYKALQMLSEHGHVPIPIHPALGTIEQFSVASSIEEAEKWGPLDTLTVYVRPERSSELSQSIISCSAKRVIFNPGTENPALNEQLQKAGKKVVEACTLVLLRTNQFDS